MIERWKSGPIYAISGESQSGKTTLAIQLAAEYSHKTGRKLLLYDTEGGGDEFLESWMPIHQEQYPKAEAVFRLKRNWRKILLDHGIPTADVGVSDKGKMKVVPLDTMAESELEKFVKANNVGIIVYDSLTAPMQAFGSNQENFPVRNSVQNLWMQQMMDLIDEHNLVVIILNHVTKNPTNPYARAEMSGGKAIRHTSKVQFFLKKWEAKGVSTYRTLMLDRFYDVERGTREGLLQLTDDGYIDRTKEQMEEARKKK